MYYNTGMKAFKEKSPLNPVLSKELHDLGRWLRVLRVQRKITIASMCERIGVKNPRTVSKIEKGDPSVSLGTFIEYLNILGLADQIAQRILGDFIHKVSIQKKRRVFTDKEIDF